MAYKLNSVCTVGKDPQRLKTVRFPKGKNAQNINYTNSITQYIVAVNMEYTIYRYYLHGECTIYSMIHAKLIQRTGEGESVILGQI